MNYLKLKNERRLIKMKPACFLDRDGVLCKEEGYITSTAQLHIFDYAQDCIHRIHQAGYLAVCVTNQAAVAKGLLEEKELLLMNECLKSETELDAVYYCPHHPDGIGKYRQNCACRKPEIGMLLKAMEDFDIDMSRSLMIGDRASDILCGQKAGVKTILLESGYGTGRMEQEVKADYIYNDLLHAVEQLLMQR